MSAETLFKGTVNDISQVAGYFALLDISYKNLYEKIGFNLSSQKDRVSQLGGEISLLLTRIKGSYKLAAAYFNEEKQFGDKELSERVDFVYTQIKDIFKMQPVQIRGYADPSPGLISVQMGDMDLTNFLMEFTRKYDHDTRTMPTMNEEQAKEVLADSKSTKLEEALGQKLEGKPEGNESNSA